MAFQVAAPAIVARTTEGIERRRLNSTIEFARSVAITAGPPLAGALVGFASGIAGLAVACVFAALALLASTQLSTLSHTTTDTKPPGTMLTRGVRFTLANPWLRPILWVSMIFNLGWFVILGVIVAWASHGIGMSSQQIGLMFGVYGAGMVSGAFVVRRISDAVPATVLVRIGPWCGLGFASLVMVSFHIPSQWFLVAAFFLVGCGPIIWSITTMGIRQAVTPPDLLGRVSAAIMVASAGSRPIGAGLGYLAYQAGGYEAAFLLGAMLFTTQALLVGGTALARHDLASPGIEPSQAN